MSLKEYLACAHPDPFLGGGHGGGSPAGPGRAGGFLVKHSDRPESFGKGNLEGIAASESANSAVVAASLIPLFTLGIPGNVVAALLIGAFVIHGMIPGPLMFEQNAQFIYSIYGSLIVANLFLLAVGRLGLRAFCKVVQVPSAVFYPIIIFTCIMGAYLAQYATFDVTLMLVFAVLAYFMCKFDYSFICLIIGFILAPIWETSLQNRCSSPRSRTRM